MAKKMTKKELYFDELSKQIDFSKNVYGLNTNDVHILEKAAKEYGYRCRDNGSQIACILHARFYVMMQTLYYKKLKETVYETEIK